MLKLNIANQNPILAKVSVPLDKQIQSLGVSAEVLAVQKKHEACKALARS
jgi:hypothetical protein